MRNNPQYPSNGAAKRCAICDGQFGLIRRYSWRTALCSKRCADRFKARHNGDRLWLRQLHAAPPTDGPRATEPVFCFASGGAR
jgi:hypothetical protein